MGDWKIAAAKRRDARHGGPSVTRQSCAKKDRKRWCGGKEGRDHKPKCVDYGTAKHAPSDMGGRPVNLYAGWKLLICTVCGKELDTYFPTRWFKRNKPDWVT